MKRCPICGARAVETAGTCFQCLYNFDTLSTEDVSKLQAPAPGWAGMRHAVAGRGSMPPASAATAPVAVLERPACDRRGQASLGAACVALPAASDKRRQAPFVADEPPAIATPPSSILIPAASPARCFSVELRSGTASPHTLKTHKGSLYIGRAIFNDLVIDEECILRRHAHIYRLEQGVFMELLSTGATATINGQPANHISLLCDGDVIGLGSCDAIICC